MNGRNTARKTGTAQLNYEKEMEKSLNTIFRNLRALEEIRRVRVSRECEGFKQVRNPETSKTVSIRLRGKYPR